jgi:hypothetical protein
MQDILLVFLAIFGLIWWITLRRHPKGFPPGPRLPLPIFGDAYVLGSDLVVGFDKMRQKYGDISGFWLGNKRAVVVSEFELIQELLNNPEVSNRHKVV